MSRLLVINMWCGPRTGSTALMYGFGQRADTLVFDEPFYGRYLRRFDPGHPGRAEIVATTLDDLDQILAAITRPDPRPVRFIKNIGHHLDAVPVTLLDRFTNGLLIRDPARIIASLGAAMQCEVALAITGLPQQVRILDHEIQAGRTPLVIDSTDLLADPDRGLAKLCARLGIDDEPAMRTWPAGPKAEDGAWAPYWYEAVHRSRGFEPPTPSAVSLTDAQRVLLEQCRPLYDRLRQHRLDLSTPLTTD